MKVALITPWDNAWIPHFERIFVSRGHQFGVFKSQAPKDSDIVLHGWAAGTPVVPTAKNVVFLRRYELFDGGLTRVNWKHVQALICVSSWIKALAERILKENEVSVPTHLIYNGVDLDKWTFSERNPGKKIGMACYINSKKNLPLAMQIFSALPKDYELHIAGELQDVCLGEYLNHIANCTGREIHIYGQVPAKHMNEWWDGMDYCLSTSMTEGNPNNVIEAMAKGIKPVVHNWPGSEDQFPDDLRFSTVPEAITVLTSSYESERYKNLVKEKFSLTNFETVADLALSL